MKILVLAGDYWHPMEVVKRGIERMNLDPERYEFDFVEDAKDIVTKEEWHPVYFANVNGELTEIEEPIQTETDILEDEIEEEMFEVDEPAAEEYDETEIGAEGTEIPAPFLEVVEDSELAPIDYATERQVISEPVEEILEEKILETYFEENK